MKKIKQRRYHTCGKEDIKSRYSKYFKSFLSKMLTWDNSIAILNIS
jgi:hypothetical protein